MSIQEQNINYCHLVETITEINLYIPYTIHYKQTSRNTHLPHDEKVTRLNVTQHGDL